MSRVLTLTHGSNIATIRCYLHTSNYLPQGWYEGAQREVILSAEFELG